MSKFEPDWSPYYCIQHACALHSTCYLAAVKNLTLLSAFSCLTSCIPYCWWCAFERAGSATTRRDVIVYCQMFGLEAWGVAVSIDCQLQDAAWSDTVCMLRARAAVIMQACSRAQQMLYRAHQPVISLSLLSPKGLCDLSAPAILSVMKMSQ